MPDPNTQLLNLAVKASRLAQSMKADRQAEAKIWQRASEASRVLARGAHAPDCQRTFDK